MLRQPPFEKMLEAAVLVIILLSLGIAFIPSHWTGFWMDREFQGWMIAVGDRLATGMKLYADQGHSPMPPLPFVLPYVLSGGGGPWIVESLLNFLCQVLALIGGFLALKHLLRGAIPFCAALTAIPFFFSLEKLAIHDSMAQCMTAWTCFAVVHQFHKTKESRFPAPACGGRRLHSTASNDAHDPSGAVRFAHSPNRDRRVAFGSSDSGLSQRGWICLGGLFNALCLLSKQSTAAGLTLGVLLAYLLLKPNGTIKGRLYRAAEHLGWTLLFSALLLLMMAPYLSISGFFQDVFLFGSEPKGGIEEALRNFGRYSYQVGKAFFPYGLAALGAIWIAGKRWRHDTRQDDQAVRLALLVASALTALVCFFALLSDDSLYQWLRTAIPLDFIREHPFIPRHPVLWTGFFIALFSTALTVIRQDQDKQSGMAALTIILLMAALFHSLSSYLFRWTYDNNPLVLLALAYFFLFCTTCVRTLSKRQAVQVLVLVVLCVFVELLSWPVIARNLQASYACQYEWPEVAHLRGAKLRSNAAPIRGLVRYVRAQTTAEEEVLILPEDPNVHKWFERKRPKLTSAILFVDQYWDRFVDEDFARLQQDPPELIVLGPIHRTADFNRLFGHGLTGFPRLLQLVETTLLPQHYTLQRELKLSGDIVRVYRKR